MAELVDAPDSKSSPSNRVWVRFPLRPPQKNDHDGLFLCYNYPMDTGGQPDKSIENQSDLSRQAAAAIARRKVLASYTNPKTTNSSAGHLKDETPKINSESWKRYHTAWQDYYQKYYSEYYANAARNYVEKERLKDAREQKEGIIEDRHQAVTTTTPENDPRDDSLRERIRKKATDSAKKSRRSRRYIPIFAGVAVVLLILFLQYNRLIFAPIMAYVSPGNTPASEIEAIDPTITRVVSPDPKLIIPKLNVDVPVHFGITVSEVMPAMNNGVAHYRIAGADAYPGEIGNLIITGHSAGDVYSSNPYKYIFSGLERLEDGDLIYVNYESTRYTYSVTKKEVVEPSNVAALIVDTNKPILTLVTCTPLGTSRYRLLVTAEQISPNSNGENTPSKPSSGDMATDVVLPSNEPSFFEGIWNWLTGN